MTTSTEPQKPRQITPPYFSVVKLVQTIELISTRNLTEVSVSFFTARGFSPNDALLAFNALKFLGLVNDAGQPTEAMAKLRIQGEARKAEFEKIVRTAYKKLFDSVDNPQNLPQVDLYNEFVAQYGLSKRIATTAIPFFYKLCEYAGLKPEGTVASRKRESKAKTGTPAAKTKAAAAVHKHEEHLPENLHGFSPTPVADGRLVLNLPATLKNRLLDDEQLNADWFTLKKALEAFADKALPKDNPAENKNPGPQEAESE